MLPHSRAIIAYGDGRSKVQGVCACVCVCVFVGVGGCARMWVCVRVCVGVSLELCVFF